VLPIGPAILALRLLTRQNGGGGTTAWRPPTSVPNFRRVAWVLLVIAWSLELVVVVGLLAAMIAPAPTSKILELAGFALIGVFGGAYLFAAFPILRALARLGKPRLVYYLAHLSLVCQRTGETYAGATLLAALALAHRGNVSEQECAWLVSRLAVGGRGTPKSVTDHKDSGDCSNAISASFCICCALIPKASG